jgi:site-specific DNA-adenine methylase
LFIYLNKISYGCIYKVDQEGKFNCGFGKHKHPKVFKAKHLKEISRLFNSVNIIFTCCSYSDVSYQIDSIIYLDPPYWKMFDKYTSERFDYDTFDDFIKSIQNLNHGIILPIRFLIIRSVIS